MSLGISKLNAERIIIACLGLGLIIRKQQFIENAPDVERFLVRTKSTYAGEWMFFTHPDWDKWWQLVEFLREKSPPELDNKTVKKYLHSLRRAGITGLLSVSDEGLVDSSSDRWTSLAGQNFSILAVVRGLIGIEAWQKIYQNWQLPFRPSRSSASSCRIHQSFSLSDRISTLAADFNFDAFPSDIDVAIMASNLPMYGREAIGHVISKSYDALVAGGEMHLIGEALNGSRDGPADPAMWGLGTNT